MRLVVWGAIFTLRKYALPVCLFALMGATVNVAQGATKGADQAKVKSAVISYKRISSKLGWSLEYPSSWTVSAICAGEANCDAADSDHVSIEAPKDCEKTGKENCGSIDISTDGKFDLSSEQRQDNLKISGYPAFETPTDKMVTLEIKGPRTFFLINWNGSLNSTYDHVKKSLVISDSKK